MKEIGRIVLDSNAVIAYRQGIAQVCKLVDESDILYLPVIVLGELLFGAMHSARIKTNKQAVLKFAEYTNIIKIDEAIAERYALIRLNLKNAGHPIPENDIWIAAVCLELDAPILSRDSHFMFIEDLIVISWDNNDN